MCPDEPELVLVFGDVDPGFTQGTLAIADGLDFRANEHNTHFKRLVDEIEVIGLAVLDYGSFRFFASHRYAWSSLRE